MHCSVLTPEKELYNGQVTSVTVPGTGGEFEVLKGHAAIVSSLQSGNVKIKDENGATQDFKILKGFVEVINNEVSVLVQLES